MGGTARRAHILVIDDTQAIIDLLRDLLEEEGYQVSASMETLDLTHIKALQPDLIIQDLLFADGTQETGWHFLTMSRLEPELARVPLILCTAAAETVKDPAMAENLNRQGVRVLLKPFNLDDLVTMVEEMLTAQKLIDQARGEERSSN